VYSFSYVGVCLFCSPHGNDEMIREASAMMFRYCIVSFRLALFLLVSVGGAWAQNAPSAKPFERFDGCVLAPDEWTDGDSFRVRLPDGRLETFRLYFVDTTESRTRGKRSDEQAAYFGLTRAEAVKLGEEAKAFTAAARIWPASSTSSTLMSHDNGSNQSIKPTPKAFATKLAAFRNKFTVFATTPCRNFSPCVRVATDYQSVGRRFESFRARSFKCVA